PPPRGMVPGTVPASARRARGSARGAGGGRVPGTVPTTRAIAHGGSAHFRLRDEAAEGARPRRSSANRGRNRAWHRSYRRTSRTRQRSGGREEEGCLAPIRPGTDPTMRAIAHGGSARFAGACPSETDTPLLGGQAVHRRRALAVEERLDLAAFGADPRDVEFRPQTDPLAFHSLLQPDDLVALLVEFDALPDQELQAAVVDVAQVRFARGLALELAD